MSEDTCPEGAIDISAANIIWYRYPPVRNSLIAAVITIVTFSFDISVHLQWYISIPAYLVSIVIGGFYWMKEGIEEVTEKHEVSIGVLMIFAAVASAVLGLWEEAAFLTFLYGAAEGTEEYTFAKTRGSIRKLLDLVPKDTILLDSGGERRVLASELNVNDVFLVRPGESMPTDGTVIKGSSSVDEAAVTGESVPVTKMPGSKIFAGTLNKEGSMENQSIGQVLGMQSI